MLKIENKKAQAAIELAVFGAILVFIFSVRNAVVLLSVTVCDIVIELFGELEHPVIEEIIKNDMNNTLKNLLIIKPSSF